MRTYNRPEILVTGGAGYIGSHTVVRLLQSGYQPIIVDNFSNSRRSVLERLLRIAGHKVPCYEADLRHRAALKQIFAKHHIQAVLHFAGRKWVNESLAQPLRYYDHNVNAMVQLLHVMQETNVQRLVFSSSGTVYGKNNISPLTEEADIVPRSPYESSKVMCETILRSAAAANPRLSAIVLRNFNPIGAHPSGLIGDDPTGGDGNLLSYLAKVAIGQQTCLQVFGTDYDTPDGSCIRDYTHVMDMADGFLAALKKSDCTTGIQFYNIGTGQGRSVLEVIRTFQEVTGRKIPYTPKPRRLGDIPVFYADPTKARQELGWQPTRDLRTMFQDSWRWQQQDM